MAMRWASHLPPLAPSLYTVLTLTVLPPPPPTLKGLLTVRDGYVLGLSSSLRLPRYFEAHSARPKPRYW